MTKELIEAFTVRYGWSPEAVLTIPLKDVEGFNKEQLKNYFSALQELSDKSLNINSVKMIDGKPIYSEEVWD